MKKIKVLHIGMSANYGGLESFVINMYRNMDKEKIQFDFIDTTNGNMAYKEEYIRYGSKIHNVVARKKNFIKSYCQLKKILVEGNYDYIHMHLMTYSWVEPIIIANKYCHNTKIIVHSHLTGFDKNTSIKEKLLHCIGKKRIKNINYIKLACGVETGIWLFGDDKNNFKVIEIGIAVDKYKYNEYFREKIRNKLGIKYDTVVFGHVGNFSYQKNYPALINIFNEYHKKNKNSKLLLLGQGTLMDDVIDKVKKMNIYNDVIFIGMVKNVNEYYSAMDFFLFPSFYEGLSIAMIEAQTAGLNCYASKNIAKETDISGNVCFVDIYDSPSNIAEKLPCKINNKNRNEVSLDTRYDVKNASRKLLNVYEEENNE